MERLSAQLASDASSSPSGGPNRPTRVGWRAQGHVNDCVSEANQFAVFDPGVARNDRLEQESERHCQCWFEAPGGST